MMSSSSKKRKIEQKGGVFNKDWWRRNMFIEVQSKAVCLLSQDSVAVFKKYDLKRHHQTKLLGFGVNLSQGERENPLN